MKKLLITAMLLFGTMANAGNINYVDGPDIVVQPLITANTSIKSVHDGFAIGVIVTQTSSADDFTRNGGEQVDISLEGESSEYLSATDTFLVIQATDFI